MAELGILPKTIDWLLEKDNPSVRYLTLINILDRQVDADDVIDARRQLMRESPVSKIFAHQNEDGGFINKKMVATYGEARAKAGYQPKYKATTWQALFLVQMGVDCKDIRVRRLANFILGANYFSDYRVFGIIMPDGKFGAPPCFVSNMVWALSRLGFYEDKRVQDSIKWLLKYQRFDDGDFKTPNRWPYKGKQDRCFSSHSCYSGCIKALRAMTVIPQKDRTHEVKQFIRKGTGFVLKHRLYKKSKGKTNPIRKEYELLTFPLTYYEDVLGVLEILLATNTIDKEIDKAVEFIVSKKTKDDRWLLEKTISRSSMYPNLGELGKENKWITYRVLCVLKAYNKIAG